jgi:hypothetical protein
MLSLKHNLVFSLNLTHRANARLLITVQRSKRSAKLGSALLAAWPEPGSTAATPLFQIYIPSQCQPRQQITIGYKLGAVVMLMLCATNYW